MARCLISFGANIGQPAETIRQAAQQIQSRLANRLTSFQLSRLFRTPAVGGPTGQPPFVNAVAALQLSDATAWDVWHVVREVEHALGRVRQERWEARRIDLDVLLFEQERIWTQHFKLPHPRMVMRRFILEPALDVASDWVEPVTRMQLGQLAGRLRNGAASILLVCADCHSAQDLLESAASKSGSQWLQPVVAAVPKATSCDRDTQSRWLGWISLDQLRMTGDQSLTVVPDSKLAIVLAPPDSRSGAAWEDIHRELANWMQVSSEGSSSSSWPLPGPRYLLSTDDMQWAEHEIVAALEAMDCPVEPIP